MPYQSWEIVVFILVAIAVIIAAYYATSFLGKRSMKTAAGRNIRVRERFAVSKDKSFYLVEVKGKVYLIAVTGRSVTLLDTLPAEDFDEHAEAPASAKSAFTGGLGAFLARFGAAMKANFMSVVKPGSGGRGGSGLYDLDKRITLQNAVEEDNLDMVFREMQNSRARRRATASRGDDDEDK